MKTLNCPFYVVRNDQDLQKVEKIFQKTIKPLYEYPFVIGKEKGFVFQDSYTEKIDTYFDEETNTNYVYNLIKLD